jgi:hypothetical protein
MIAAALAFFAVISTGCVERRFRIESNPPGAYVFINNVPYGPAPVDVEFIYYGKYDITLVKEGFETLKVKEPISTPWYEYPVVDFFSENIYPGQITDIRPLHYDLEPVIQPNLDQLKGEAEELRKRGLALPAPRYPDIDKKERKDKKGNRIPGKETPGGPPPPPEALPPPRELPGLPTPKSGEPPQ